MQNQIYPQYTQNYQGQIQQGTPCYQTTPSISPSVGAVNIQIFNPTANSGAQGFYQPIPCGTYPMNYNNMFQTPNPSMQNTGNIDPSINQTMNLNNNQNGVAAQSDVEGENKTEKKEDKENKPKVALTDDYIKTLENYLNSDDKKIRLMGAKEVFDRFKEDETRKDDAALTALLNKTLQDPAETVKFVGLTTLDAGYATGNNETAQILQQMQSSTSSYGEDAALASQILLKMSGYQANQEAEALNNTANLSQNQSLNQNANETMSEPSLQKTANSLNSVDGKLPPTETDTLLKQNSASMVPEINSQAVA